MKQNFNGFSVSCHDDHFRDTTIKGFGGFDEARNKVRLRSSVVNEFAYITRHNISLHYIPSFAPFLVCL